MTSPLTEDVICFRFLVAYVAEQLSEPNRESLVFIYRLPELCKKATALEVLFQLETRGVFSNPHELIELFIKLERINLAKHVEKRNLKELKKKATNLEKGRAHVQGTL